jgi:butyryl-CoA dehydrogenase
MHFALNEDQMAVRDMAREFAAEKIAPHALRWDEEKHFPVDVMREAATLGMGGIYIKDDVGGSAMTRFDAALIFEALATGCPTVSAFISIHNMASWMIDAYGNDTQRQKWLPKALHDGADRKLLPHRAGRRLGCRGAADPRGA